MNAPEFASAPSRTLRRDHLPRRCATGESEAMGKSPKGADITPGRSWLLAPPTVSRAAEGVMITAFMKEGDGAGGRGFGRERDITGTGRTGCSCGRRR